MKTHPLSTNPATPYFGNTLDNEIIAANIKLIEDELSTEHYFQVKSSIVIDDEIMFSTTTEERIHVCYEIGNHTEAESIQDIVLDEEEGMYWDDSF